MPLSNYLHLPTVLHFVANLQPRSILDVGTGMGAYGFLIRQYFDVGYERLHRSDWQLKIDGVEIFEGYRNPVWDYAYDNIFLGDIRDVAGKLGRYDLVICNDVLEHFEIDEARSLIAKMLEVAPVLIATTPNVHSPQGAWLGNHAEEHHSLLAASDFQHLVATKVTGDTSCFVCCKEPSYRAIIERASAQCPSVNARQWRYFRWRLKSTVRQFGGRSLRALGLRS
jgi:2-polyprenyl-3-methyl-5-hydroxy-6-metoxy-1,4-benzoquinol methylase